MSSSRWKCECVNKSRNSAPVLAKYKPEIIPPNKLGYLLSAADTTRDVRTEVDFQMWHCTFSRDHRFKSFWVKGDAFKSRLRPLLLQLLPLQWGINVCAFPQMDVKHPTVSFTKSRWAITDTLDTLKISVLNYRGHCISGSGAPPAKWCYSQLWAARKRRQLLLLHFFNSLDCSCLIDDLERMSLKFMTLNELACDFGGLGHSIPPPSSLTATIIPAFL